MGDRAWIQIESVGLPEPVLLYGHWSGEDGRRAVENVLARTARIGDAPYLAAQIFYEFAVVLGNYDGELGFGISTGEIDQINEHQEDNPLVVVDADTGEMRVVA